MEKPRITVLDGYTLNPGDLSWESIERHGPTFVHDRTPKTHIIERAADSEIVFTNKTPLDRATLEQLPGLRYIGVLATGYNVVDLEAARERGIVVTNIPSYGTASVAQHTFALILELTNHVARHDDAVHAGGWVECPDFCFTRAPMMELAGLTLGIVGLGEIGRAVAALGQAFGMDVRGCSRTPKEVPGVTRTDRDTLFADADILTLHCPLTEDTRELVNAETLGRMKAEAFLINTSRGPLIDEAALAEALRSGRLAGAAVDVLSAEPPRADNPLLSAPNCIITPHNAWATRAARQRLMAIAADNLAAFLDGSPTNVVN
ncbi:MAG: D-2-hydroxyacid dehydrogenase [Opitutales bacterium]